MAKTNYGKYVVPVLMLAILVAVVGFGTGYFKAPTLAFSVAGNGTPVVAPTPETPAGLVGTCESSTALSLTPNVFDQTAGNETTNRNADYNVLYYFNGTYNSSGAAGTALTTVPVNTKVDLYFIDKTTAATTAYGFVDSVQMGCQNQTYSKAKGMRTGALTVTMYDMLTGDPTANTITATTAFGAGETMQWRWHLRSSTVNTRFGTVEGGAEHLLVIDYNNLIELAPTVSGVSDGTFSTASVPNGHSSVAVVTSATTSTAYLIKTGKLANLGSMFIEGSVAALSSTANPASVDGNVGFTLYDKQLFQNANGTWTTAFTATSTSGDKSSGNDLGRANTTDTFHIT